VPRLNARAFRRLAALALGSYWGLVPFAATMPFLIWRLADEERFLARRLPGYTDYQRQVPYRLIPRVC
jgi:protein-S-isoprenylcysteine O-methyltransferase Ste14